MTTFTHETAPTGHVEANGIHFAYRRFGRAGGVPVVFNQHFTGTLDDWDPAVTDGLAATREVILFDNAGVAGSSGETPSGFPEMGANAITFVRALGLTKVDVLGFSIGGMVAQEIALQAPDLVRKLILVGTGPRGADMAASQSAAIFGATYDPAEHLWLKVHFSPSAASQAAGLAFLERKWRRTDRDRRVTEQTVAAHREAIGRYIAFREVEGHLDYLKAIHAPTLVVQGSNDVIIPTLNSYVLQQNLPNAQLILYPDANHGSFYQYPELFVAEATLFLDRSGQSPKRAVLLPTIRTRKALPMSTLTNKVALVTGGSRGIGAGIAKRLAADGARVAITYTRGAEAAAQVVKAIEEAGGKAIAVQADAADAQAVEAAVERTVSAFGGLDILVNNAGTAIPKPFEESTLAEMDRVVEINLRGVFIATHAALKHLPNGGRIINIGSCVGERMGTPGLVAYSATKGAVKMFTQGLAREVGSRGITVNNVQPGPIDTDLNPAAGDWADPQIANTALKRYGHVDDIAAMVAFVAGPEAGYITGASLTVDGGTNA